MTNSIKAVKITALIELCLTAAWVLLTAFSTTGVSPEWSTSAYIQWAADSTFLLKLNYINATILTLVAMVLFMFLFLYLKDDHRPAAWGGILFIPLYGCINIICYSLQISFVPALSRQALTNSETSVFAAQLIQVNSGSLIGYLNGLAYAILGIPSVLYGFKLIKEKKRGSGGILAASGTASIIGLVGYSLGNPFISQGVMVGGGLFLVSLLFMIIEFKTPAYQ